MFLKSRMVLVSVCPKVAFFGVVLGGRGERKNIATAFGSKVFPRFFPFRWDKGNPIGAFQLINKGKETLLQTHRLQG